MNKKGTQKTDWPALIFLLVGIPLGFSIGGLWIGLLIFVLGAAALGWGRRK